MAAIPPPLPIPCGASLMRRVVVIGSGISVPSGLDTIGIIGLHRDCRDMAEELCEKLRRSAA